MSGIPDYPLEATFDFQFNTRTSAGAPITFAGTPAFEIYEDNSVTQITGAETLTVDHDGATGAHNLRVVGTAANGFESGKSYFCRVSAGTVDGQSVIGETIQQFSIERSSAFIRLGAPAGASMSADVAAIKAETALLDALVIQSTTIATLASQTSFTLTAGSADDTAYAKMLAVVTDQSTGVQKAVGVISSYVGSTKTIALREDPLIFTMAMGDKIDIVVVSPDILTMLAQISRLANVGAASHVPANGFVLTTGSQVNTFADTEELDGTLHELSDTAGTLDALYKFDLESDNVPTLVTFTGVFKGGNDDFIVSANAGTDATPVWKQIGTLEGTGSNDTAVETFTLFANQIVTDVADEVQVRINNTGLTSASFDVDQVFVSRSSVFKSVGYALGQIWVNTVSGKAGTIKDKNGVADNAVLTWAEAVTISGLFVVPMTDFHVINGSAIALSGNSDNYTIVGDNYTLNLNNKSCVDIHVEGAAVSGVGTAATGEMHFEGSTFLTASVQGGHFDFTRFKETTTFSLAGDYQIHDSYSGVAGPNGPTFAFTAGVITAEWRDWDGSINFTGLTSNHTLTVGGTLGTVDLGSPASAVVVEIRDIYKEIINVGSAVVNTDGATQSSDVADILDDTGTSGVLIAPTGFDLIVSTATGMVEIAKAVWDRIISKANHNIGQSAGKILRLSGNIAQVDGAVSDASPTVGGFDTTLTDIDEYWEDALLVFANGAANAGLGLPISTFLNTNGAMTFAAPDDWPVTPVNGDDFTVYGLHVHPVGQIADAVSEEVLSGHTTEGTLGKAINDQAAAAALITPMTIDTIINGHTPTVSEFQADNITDADANTYLDRSVFFISGNVIRQGKRITGYVLVGGIGQFTTEAFTQAPANNDQAIIV